MAAAPWQRMTQPVGVPEEDGSVPEEDDVSEEDGGSA